MRSLGVFLLLCCCAVLHGQQANNTITIKVVDQPLEVVLDSISVKTNYYFAYNSSLIPTGSKFSCEAKGERLSKFLDRLLVGTGIAYQFQGDQIILKRLPPEKVKLPSGPTGFIITGWAREFDTGDEIPGVNVFLNGTSIGAVTNNNGFYKFENVPFGSYELVFSHVSYQKSIFEVNVGGTGSIVVNGTMKFRTNELSEIEVSSSRLVASEDWEKTYEIFKKEFFGESFNARRCSILNPDVLQFYTSDEGRVLYAEASQPLRIRNEALGYMIIYELEYFENFEQRLVYYGKVRFEQLPVTNQKQRKLWRKNRKSSYQGSLRHFLKSMVQGNLRRQGFRVYKSETVIGLSDTGTEKVKIEEVMSRRSPVEWQLEFPDYLYIEYLKEKESDQYLFQMAKELEEKVLLSTDNILFLTRKPDIQRSLVKLKESYVNIDANGHIKQPLGVTTIGYWSWERFADILPIDYDPKTDKL